MIQLIIDMLDITESKHENIQFLKGKYHLKLNLKDAIRQVQEFKT